MKTVALTGGIATGKSTAGEIFRRLDPHLVFFDCDAEVQRLLTQTEVLEEISATLDHSVILPSGELDRDSLRRLVFTDPAQRKKLEAVLHPKVRQECLEKRDLCRHDPATTLFVADVPLLFESGFELGQDLTVVVATSSATQRIRLQKRSHFADTMISSILQAQLPILEKLARADVVLWNEGPREILERQVRTFLNSKF